MTSTQNRKPEAGGSAFRAVPQRCLRDLSRPPSSADYKGRKALSQTTGEKIRKGGHARRNTQRGLASKTPYTDLKACKRGKQKEGRRKSPTDKGQDNEPKLFGRVTFRAAGTQPSSGESIGESGKGRTAVRSLTNSKKRYWTTHSRQANPK